MLQRRLFRRPGFPVILLLMLLLSFAMRLTDRADSGALTVALAAEEPGDPIAAAVTEELSGDDGLIRFLLCETPDAARLLVENGTADSAWIFRAGTADRVAAFAAVNHEINAPVTIIQREESVLLALSREKLYAALYPHNAYALYRGYVTEEIPELGDISEEQFRAAYDAVDAPGDGLFRFALSDPDNSVPDGDSISYLMAPVRGLLSIFVVLAGLAAAMFYLQDERAGRFDWIPAHVRPAFAFLYHLTAVADAAAAALIALFLSGVALSPARELLLMLLYLLPVTGFCMLLGQLCGRVALLGVLIPPLTVSMIVLCPVFFSVPGILRLPAHLLPPFSYLNAVYSTGYLLPMLLLSGVCLAAAACLVRFRTR